ncbi:MAG TPA: hypothetical protein VGH28_19730 [Polyangiaceae bacterium]|jgi:hypothetical protein
MKAKLEQRTPLLSRGRARSAPVLLSAFALLLTGCDDEARSFGIGELMGAPFAALASSYVGALVLAGHRRWRPELRAGILAQLATFAVLAGAAAAAVLLDHAQLNGWDLALAVPGMLTVQLLVWTFWVVGEWKGVSWGRAGILASAVYFAPAVPLALGYEPEWLAFPAEIAWLVLFGFGIPFFVVLLATTLMLRAARPRTI